MISSQKAVKTTQETVCPGAWIAIEIGGGSGGLVVFLNATNGR